MTDQTQINPGDGAEILDKESLCSSSGSTPAEVRRRISDVNQTKEKYVKKAKSTISAGKK